MNYVDSVAVRGAVIRSGLHLCVGVPVGMLAITLILHKSFSFLSQPLIAYSSVRLVSYAFIAVALVDAAAAFMLKRRLINPTALMTRYTFRTDTFASQLSAAYTPVFALCAMPAVYGLVSYFLCSDLDTYVLISVICPASFLFIKPKEEEIERLSAEIFRPTADSDIHL